MSPPVWVWLTCGQIRPSLLSRCLSIHGIIPVVKRDEATHLIYALGLTGDDLDRLAMVLNSRASMKLDSLWMGVLTRYINTGCSRAMSSLYTKMLGKGV